MTCWVDILANFIKLTLVVVSQKIRFTTHLTAVRAFASVKSSVHSQVARRAKPLATERTFIWAFTCYNKPTAYVRIRTDSKNLFARTLQDLQRPNSRVFQDSQNSFSRLSRINSVHKHGCIRSKKCTVFLKFKLTQKVSNCTQCFTIHFFFSWRYLCQKLIFSGPQF